MALIQVKFDNTLKQSEIRIPLTNSSQQEAGIAYTDNKPEIQQTLVYGIQAPLIMINTIVVDFTDVISFELKSTSILPEVHLIVRDRCRLSSILDTPSIDNELRIQILPKFEDKYKKINLTFYITNIRIKNNEISITGKYKAPQFISSNIKSFGEVSTYGLFQAVAQETCLGFATNVEDAQDKKYVYCPNKPYSDILMDELRRSCTDLQVYDYWIDWWNNIVLVDIFERYNAIDRDEDMQIWISGQQKEVAEGSEIQPIKTVATFHNNPAQKTTELFVTDYRICNSPGLQMYEGTDRVYSIYETSKTEYMDHLIQDGDAKKDIFAKYEYLGEVYGEHNYLLSKKIYDTFQQKIQSNEVVEIDLRTPLLGIMRGNRVNFLWYINDSKTENLQKSLQNEGCVEPNPQTNIPIDNNTIDESPNTDGEFILDKSISGQYLVTKCNMKFKEGLWTYTVTLARPTNTKPQLINEEQQ